MDIFEFRNQLIKDYQAYINSFIRIKDPRISDYISNQVMGKGLLWPEPLIQLNPSFARGDTIDDLVSQGILHSECKRVFRIKAEQNDPGKPLHLHKHQSDAVRTAVQGRNYVLTTGTGSGKSMAYIVPIVDHVLKNGTGKGIQAIVVYPMNALANSQSGELRKFLSFGYPDGKGPVTFRRYTGQENDEEKNNIIANPPDIILTNYVMLELILTRPNEKNLIASAKGLRYLVLDELHTYRGRQGSDVALLIRRVREALNAQALQCVGTSATLVRHGTLEQQRKEVSAVASMLFGDEVRPDDVISETLQRATPEASLDSPDFMQALRGRLADPNFKPQRNYQEFVKDPLSSWIETTFGIRSEPESRRLIRAEPQTISGEEGGAAKLSRLINLDLSICEKAIQKGLLGGFQSTPNPETGFPPFAFRLHQFISRGDTAYSSLEDEESRYLTISGQQFVPGDRNKILLPIVFCRECGQEYYSVIQTNDPQTHQRAFKPRNAYEKVVKSQDSIAGFLFYSSTDSWPIDAVQLMDRLPDEWLENYSGATRVRKDRKEDLPRAIRISPTGIEDNSGLDYQFIRAPFRFCLNCGVSYGFRQSSDFGKLTSLGSEGRSTATTILSLNSVLLLKKETELADTAKKLLSFTDNRQDASLQAGHFNDFVEIGLLRSALFKAVQKAGQQGISHEQLTQEVFDALNLPVDQYATDPLVKFAARAQTDKALREVLGYRLYRDLKRGWRITAPNLEQCGLLEIQYLSLDELCQSDDIWGNFHPALSSATAQSRHAIAKVLLDYMRRELSIKVDYLDPRYQEQIEQVSSQRLISPWAIDENERNNLEHAAILFPRSIGNDYGGNVYLSARSGFGMYLRRGSTLPEYQGKPNLEETQEIIKQLLEALRTAGLVEIVKQADKEYGVPGYQLVASSMIWKAGDGTQAFYDPVRVPNAPRDGGATNPYFINLYKSIAGVAHGIHAREHTAQVQSDVREQREKDFGEGKLPILYCSPTMELGVDIKELNVVNMRNIPPTSANYSQRSGRAGRSGQPALVFSYCSTGSPHDQYFFKRPHLMVSGAVNPARLDLANEDLIRAHVHAIWIAEAGLKLGKTLKELLDVSGESPTLTLLDDVREDLRSEAARERAKVHSANVLRRIENELKTSDWYTEKWLEDVFQQLERKFDDACERWRGLYRSALRQAQLQTKIIHDASKSAKDKDMASRLRREAESQLDLLTKVENVVQSDFYSYRYFASEGFLPGYNFPRLPLSAFIPGRMSRQRDEFLSRPRFIAISEFGPKATVYHEGSRYEINKVMLPMDQDLITGRVKQCSICGYLHPITDGEGPDLCERCHAPLPAPIKPLLRLQNVATKRRNRISSDEEERLRLGYEIKTGYRFSEISGAPAVRLATAKDGEEKVAELNYGSSATLWRINLGWARRVNKEQRGFVLDTERGYWARSDEIEDEEDDPISNQRKRVIPYVEDRRNCLIFTPTITLDTPRMASLQSALKSAIQVRYQLEDSELAAEPLPSRDDRRSILFYESSEGGAGVLRRLIDDAQDFPKVCREALTLCHFEPETGNDQHHAPRSKEKCEAACYDCLLNYTNQRDHELLDRQSIKDLLIKMARSTVETAPAVTTREEHIERLMRLCASDLERSFLKLLETHRLRLPSKAQSLIEVCSTRPDFFYDEGSVAIYIDGPHHLFAHRHERDVNTTEKMEDAGYLVIRFGQEEDWLEKVKRYPNIFGKLENNNSSQG